MAQSRVAVPVIGFFVPLRHKAGMSAAHPPRIECLAQEAALTRLAAAGGIGAPFQSAGWIEAFLPDRQALRLVEIRDAEGQWLLPLAVEPSGGVARKIGGDHAGLFTPVRVGHPAPLTRASLKAAGHALGVDALLLKDCPAQWAGVSPFEGRFPAAPDLARGVSFGAAPQEVLARLYAGEPGKKLRAKTRKLGALDSGFLTGEAAYGALETLLGWKATLFAQRGIADPFLEAGIRESLLRGLAPGGPLRLFALRQEGRLISALVLAQAGGHASGMANGHDPEESIARFGPGDVLLGKLVETLVAEGATGFDLGVGDARYKRLHCPEPMALIDVFVPVTLRGRMLVQAQALARRAKGAIKRNPAAFSALQSLRATLRAR
jgi:CelD/BcsL family acetyltransferase involved in cellulose biosynthesis